MPEQQLRYSFVHEVPCYHKGRISYDFWTNTNVSLSSTHHQSCAFLQEVARFVCVTCSIRVMASCRFSDILSRTMTTGSRRLHAPHNIGDQSESS